MAAVLEVLVMVMLGVAWEGGIGDYSQSPQKWVKHFTLYIRDCKVYATYFLSLNFLIHQMLISTKDVVL